MKNEAEVPTVSDAASSAIRSGDEKLSLGMPTDP
jgi:hypothetical protein